MDFHRNLWIGLSGGIATGKSTVSDYLSSLGLAVIDADSISHELVRAEGLAISQLVSEFGQDILEPDGSISRPKLGQIVFSDKNKLMALNKIMHPLVRQLTEKKKKDLTQKGHKVIFNDVPLLFENQLQATYDSAVVVYCPEELQRQRLKVRNNMSDDEINKRLNSQMDIEEKVNLADHVIDNSGTIEDLKKNINTYLNKLSTL